MAFLLRLSRSVQPGRVLESVERLGLLSVKAQWFTTDPEKPGDLPTTNSAETSPEKPLDSSDSAETSPEADKEVSAAEDHLIDEDLQKATLQSQATPIEAEATQLEGESTAEDDLIDEDLQKAALQSQARSKEAEAPPPYESDFPLRSPLLEEENSTSSLSRRELFIQELTSKATSLINKQQSKPDEEEEEKQEEEDKDETATDPDTGFAELGGFTTEVITGMFDEQPMKLHPARIFYPGHQYEPEDLHPYGVIRETRGPRRSRNVGIVYSAQQAKEKLDFKNLAFLNNYLSDAGMILSRRQTRLPKQLQKKLQKSVKLAQALALLPVLDRRMEFKRKTRRTTETDLFT